YYFFFGLIHFFERSRIFSLTQFSIDFLHKQVSPQLEPNIWIPVSRAGMTSTFEFELCKKSNILGTTISG
ncbi:hypothetical protein JR312_03065, partial [Wolbachia endosymbiont of Nasonia giraulti]|uniref:hypothetical protein n=1 Tax=Wolbachia endosymbiont of Nasonia giraulti TaxID=180838 RepID=UPI003A862C67